MSDDKNIYTEPYWDKNIYTRPVGLNKRVIITGEQDRAQVASCLIMILEDTLSANLLLLEDENELSFPVILKMPLSSVRERMIACVG